MIDRRAQFHIYRAQNSCFSADMQFDIGKGKFGAGQGDPILRSEVQAAAAEPAAVLNEKDRLRESRVVLSLWSLRQSRVHADNASRNEVGKSVGIVLADLGIEIGASTLPDETGRRVRRTYLDELTEGRNGGKGSIDCAILKPGDVRLWIVESGIEENRTGLREADFERHDVVERETEDPEPIGQAVAGQSAERECLLDGGAPCRGSQLEIEVPRKVIARLAWVGGTGPGGGLVEREISA